MAKMPVLRDHRFRVMEAVLQWEGEIRNARVRHLFDLQPVQASRLLGEFREKWGSAIHEDSRAKVLRANNAFSADVPLEEYARYVFSAPTEDDCLVDARVSLDRVQPATFAALRMAARSQKGVVIKYASMTTPDSTPRTIFPHSLVLVGRRWHARAWCLRHQDFRDFVIGRISAITPTQEPAPFGKEDDKDWNTEVVIRLGAHRALTPEQQQVIRREYFANTQARRIKVRACIAQYIVQDLRAATDPSREIPPAFQLEVTNFAEIAEVLFPGALAPSV